MLKSFLFFLCVVAAGVRLEFFLALRNQSSTLWNLLLWTGKLVPSQAGGEAVLVVRKQCSTL